MRDPKVMKWNREELSHLLNAKIIDTALASGSDIAIVTFEDGWMRYEMWISADSVFIAADPEKPVQALPFFEMSVPCIELAPVPRSGMPTGIGMFSGPI